MILSLFGGIFSIFGGIAYFFQIWTNRSIANTDKAQFDNFEVVFGNQKGIRDALEHHVEESECMQQKIMKKIEELENSLKEMGEIIKRFE